MAVKELPDYRNITLTVSLAQLQAVEMGISTALRVLNEYPPEQTEKTRDLLLDTRAEIDRALTEKAASLRAFDAEHVRRSRAARDASQDL